MAKKKEKSIGHIIKYLMVVPAIIKIIEGIVHLAKNEAAMIRRKLILLVVMALFTLILIGSVWLCFSTLLVFYLMSLHISVVAAVAFTLIFNLMLLLITSLIVAQMDFDPFLPETRKVIKEMIS